MAARSSSRALRRLFERMAASRTRVFPMSAAAARVRPLQRPSDFYDTLVAAIGRAEER